MFWDRVARVYDVFEKVYNGKVIDEMCNIVCSLVSPSDRVLECACGTGFFTRAIAPKCKTITATDMSIPMLREAKKKCRRFSNVRIKRGDITNLIYKDNSFDVVVAGNVIHLLDEPELALSELRRVCKPNGKIVIPTYINNDANGEPSMAVALLEQLGASFKRQFDFESYRLFFAERGYEDVRYIIANGKMPCAIAVIYNR